MSPEAQPWFFSKLITVLLIGLFWQLHVKGQVLTIYTIPAPRDFHWESPGKLVFSYVSNFLTKNSKGTKRHVLGHMIVELKDSSRHVITGVSAVKNSGMTRKVLFQRHGLGILFDKISGVMDETDINLPDIKQRAGNGEIAFLQFRVNQPVFDRLWQYYSDYKERGYYRFYNGLNKPRDGEGAGCSAFAFSFLEVGGLLDMVPPEICRIERPVPFSLIRNLKENQGPVSLLKLVFSRKWAAENDPIAPMYITYEPTWLFNWIKRNQVEMPVTGKVQQVWLDKSPGILIDCFDKPVPPGPLWKN